MVVIGLLAALGVLSGLQALLIQGTNRRIAVIFVEVIAMGIFFYNFDPPFLVAALILAFVLFVWGYWETRRELHYATTIRFFSTTRGVLGKFVTATLLFMILLYVPQQSSRSFFLPESSFSAFFTWSAGLAETWYPNLPLTGSFGDLAQNLVQSQLKGNPAFENLSPANQSTTIAMNATQLVASFSNNLGVAIHASDTIASVAYDFIMRTLTGWQNRFAGAFLVGWTVVIFLVLRSIGIAFGWLIQLLLAACYELLLSTGAVKVKERPATQEVIEF